MQTLGIAKVLQIFREIEFQRDETMHLKSIEISKDCNSTLTNSHVMSTYLVNHIEIFRKIIGKIDDFTELFVKNRHSFHAERHHFVIVRA